MISKLAQLHNTLLKYEVVFVSKSTARNFLLFCKMVDTDVQFSLSGNKIMFQLKQLKN